MSDITIKALREKVDEFLEIKKDIKDLEGDIKALHERLNPLTQEITAVMEALEMDRFDGTTGRISKLKIDYVSNPQTDEDKQAFTQFLKDEGIFEDMVSVHHQKLNSFYKDRLAQAIEDGEELNIPGLQPKQRTEIRKSR